MAKYDFNAMRKNQRKNNGFLDVFNEDIKKKLKKEDETKTQEPVKKKDTSASKSQNTGYKGSSVSWGGNKYTREKKPFTAKNESSAKKETKPVKKNENKKTTNKKSGENKSVFGDLSKGVSYVDTEGNEVSYKTHEEQKRTAERPGEKPKELPKAKWVDTLNDSDISFLKTVASDLDVDISPYLPKKKATRDSLDNFLKNERDRLSTPSEVWKDVLDRGWKFSQEKNADIYLPRLFPGIETYSAEKVSEYLNFIKQIPDADIRGKLYEGLARKDERYPDYVEKGKKAKPVSNVHAYTMNGIGNEHYTPNWIFEEQDHKAYNQQMTERERNTVRYLSQVDPDALKDYGTIIDPAGDERRRRTEDFAKMTEEHPVLGSIGGIMINTGSSLMTPFKAMHDTINPEYRNLNDTVDYNSGFFIGNNATEGVNEGIERATESAGLPSTVADLGKFGVSAADNLLGTAINTLNPVMGGMNYFSKGFSGSVYDSSQRGMDPLAAMGLGVWDGAWSTLIDKTMDKALYKNVKSGKGLLQTAHMQGLQEMPSETAESVLNNLGDEVFSGISGNDSRRALYAKELMEQGYSPFDATLMSLGNSYIAEPAKAGVEGYAMGAITGAGGKVVSDVSNYVGEKRVENAWTDLIKDAKTKNIISEADRANAGVVRDEFTKSMDQNELNELDEFAKANGVRIEFADGVRNGTADASVNGRTIKIDKATTRPYNFLLGHEMTHFMQGVSKDAYAKFEKLASKRISNDYINSVYSRYTNAGVEGFTYQNAIEEAVADYAGGLVSDSKSLDAFIADNRNDKGILGTVRSAVSYLKDKLTGKGKQDAEVAETKLTDAINGVNLENKNTAQTDGERYAIAPTLKDDIGAVRNGTFPKSSGEVVIGTTSDFLVNKLKLNPLTVSMPQNKMYAAMVTEDVAKAEGKYDGTLHYHNLGEDLLFDVLEASEHPIAAFVDENGIDKNGNIQDRSDRIVLVTDKTKDGKNIVVVMQVDAPGIVNTGRATVNKDVTIFDKDYVFNAIEKAAAEGRLLDFDKKRSQTISAGVKAATLPRAIQNVDFDANIAHFRDNVNWKRSEKQTNFEGDTPNKTAFEIAYEKALSASEGKEQFSIKRDSALDGLAEDGEISTDEKLAQMREDYGTIPAGEKPYRDVELPERTAKDKYVSQTVRTILEAKATPEIALKPIETLVAEGEFSYDRYTDKAAQADAEAVIKDKGWNIALADWLKASRNGFISKKNTAIGWQLYNNAVNSGDMKTALEIVSIIANNQRDAAQAVQATRILKKLSPEAQLYQAQRSVENLQREINARHRKNGAPELKINEELAKQFIKSETQEQRDEVLKEIYRDIGRQVPPTFADKWRAWRYLAMLGNARTHVRNISGNAVFSPVVSTKNLIATGLEGVASKVTGGKFERTKAYGRGLGELKKAAKDDYKNVADIISSGGKYGDEFNMNQYIREGQKIFTSKNAAVNTVLKLFEWLRQKNSAAMEAEDRWFAKPRYAEALAQYCKANGITAEQIAAGEIPDAARSYAIKEAQKATFRDVNALSHFVSRRFRETGEFKKSAKIGNALIDGILPFRKTPANILARGVEYSPVGLATTITKGLYDVKKGNKLGAEFIDGLASGLTGTGILGLGYALASMGIIRGHGSDDEKEREFEELMGHQGYSLELPNGTSVTLDWLAPEALPFFVGVNLYEQSMKEDDGEPFTLSEGLGILGRITEPMLEMSCLQGLNSLFESVGYATSNDMSALTTIVSSALSSFFTQAFPTILGQAERTGESESYTTFTEKNAFLTPDIQRTLGNVSRKIPGWDFQQIPYIDAWGRTEKTGNVIERAFNNFLNPAYTSDVEESRTEKELKRLYDATGEGGVFPQRADKYFTVDGKKKYLSEDEYTEYATVKGETSYRLLRTITESREYKDLSDVEKADVVSFAYDYANQKAKESVSKFKPEDWVLAMDEAKKLGISEIDFILINKMQSEKAEDVYKTLLTSKQKKFVDSTVKEENSADMRRMALLKRTDLTPEQKAYIDKTCISELKRPIDYSSEDSFYFSKLTEAKQKRYPEVAKRWDNIDAKTYYRIIDACSGLKKKSDIIAKLYEVGFRGDAAYRFYNVVFKP